MKPTVSVLIPVFNGLPYIEQTIRSVLEQSFTAWELIIADNASTDGTVAAVEKFQDPRIRLIRHPKNIGIAPNWDFLLQLATTDYACILGADDLFAPDHLERKVGLMKEHPEASYVHGAVNLIDSAGKELPPDNFECAPLEHRKETMARFLTVNFANITSILFRVAALRRQRLGFEARYALMMDWALQLKLAMLEGPIVYDRKATVSYRIHATSVARKTMQTFDWPMESLRLRVDALLEHPEIWREIGIDPLRKARSMTENLWRLAFQQLRRNNLPNAQQAWKFYRELHQPAEVLRGIPGFFQDAFHRVTHRKMPADSHENAR